jgi:hypothetical protein
LAAKKRNSNLKNRTLIFGIISALVFASLIIAFILSINSEKKKSSFIPDSAVLVWESSQLKYSAEKSKDFSIIKNIQNFPFYEVLSNEIEILDTLLIQAQISNLFEEEPLRISLHPISNSDFDLIYYLPLGKKKDELLKVMDNKHDFKISKREFQGKEIHDIIASDLKYSFSLQKGFMIISKTPFLIEDVIRQLEKDGGANFYSILKKNLSKTMVKNDDGEIYVNAESIAELAEIFLKSDNQSAIDMLNSFGSSTYYDINLKDDFLLLSGASKFNAEPKTYLDIFQNEPPKSFELKNKIPSNTALLFSSSFGNGKKLLPKLKIYFQKSGQARIMADWKTVAKENKVYLDKFFELIASEIALCILESNNPANPEKLLFIQTSSRENAIEYLKSISENFFVGQDQEAFFEEYYKGKLIREISKEEFPALLFGEYYSGFEECFYFFLDDHIVLSNSINAARKLIDDIDDEKVWGKSVKQNLFLEQCISETNINLILNTARNWEYVKYNLNENWVDYTGRYSENIKQFQLMAFQFASLKDRFYAGAVIKHKEYESGIIKEKKKRMNTQWAFKNSSKFITKAKVVRNHNDNSFECLVQDEELNLHLISKKGERLWSVKLLDKIIDEGIHQIDFYKNGKLQYAICGEKYFYMIDRKGNTVENYPVNFAKEDNQILQHFRVLDYEKSRKYRFLISDNKGNAFITDKNLNILEGWDPIVQKSGNSAAPDHFRISGKDFIVLIQKNGVLDVKKRNGQSYPNFPLELYNRINTNYFIQADKDFESSIVHILDNEGLLKRVDLNGKIQSEKQFYKPDKDSEFELVLDGLGQTYLIARKDPNGISLLNRTEKEIAQIKTEKGNTHKVQFYNFGADNEIYIITDVKNSKTFLFNSGGEISFKDGLRSSNELSILYYDSEELYKVYKVFDNELSLITFEN